MHHYLFGTTTWFGDRDWIGAGKVAGVPDIERFANCLKSPEASERLERDTNLASVLSIKGTPAFLHRGGLAAGAANETQLRRLLDELMSRERVR